MFQQIISKIYLKLYQLIQTHDYPYYLFLNVAYKLLLPNLHDRYPVVYVLYMKLKILMC